REGSYKLALEAYQHIDQSPLSDDERRWIGFRLADLSWRSAPEGRDHTQVQAALRALENLLHDEKGEPIRDRVAVEAMESKGDLLARPSSGRWSEARVAYLAALDWWAGARDVEEARGRYLHLVWKSAEAPGGEESYRYSGLLVPLDILRNAATIATTADDKSHASYLIALQLMQQSDPQSLEETRKSFDAALGGGKSTRWYDDTLMSYGRWLETYGILTWLDDGTWRVEPDYEAALSMYRRLTSEFKEGESQYWPQAHSRIADITQPSLAVAVSNVFLPGSKTEFHLHWRNVGAVQFSMSKVDLTEDLNQWPSSRLDNWYQAIDASAGRGRFSWTKTVQSRRYAPGDEQVAIERELTPGAWLLEASTTGAQSVRELILVTDVAIVTRTSPAKTLVWVTNAQSGAPVGGAKVRVLYENYDSNGGEPKREQATFVTGTDGIADVALRGRRNGQILVFANAQDHQAFSQASSFSAGDRGEEWRIYAASDRPAYRPGETANWKITARLISPGGYSVPANRTVTFEIHDPRGASVKKGALTLNEFGSAWAELPFDASMALGPYQVTFADANRSIGSATLFRLEEYKLPEFRVAVKTTDEHGAPKAFRLGDTVDVTIEASYFFGGPVTNATVEAVVYQSPYYRRWSPTHDYPWYFDSQNSRPYYGGHGQIVKKATLVTDAAGRARLSFETPASGGQDFEYRIEARVTDASRREISSTDSIRVTRAPYFAEARPKHWLYRPGDAVEVEFRTIDANDQPVRATGPVKITREQWKEVWLDPAGQEVSGRALDLIRARPEAFPPPPEKGHHPWLLVSRGYEHEEVLTTTLTSDEKGRAVLKFVAPKEGYYRFQWTSHPMALPSAKPRPRDVVEASTAVWVATKETMRIGYYHEGGIEILVDEDTVKPGATVPAMIVVPQSDRYVLLDVAGDEILSRQLVHVTGNVKLVELTLGDEHIPNVFLTASMVSDLQLHQDTKEIVVPPVQKFLSLELQPDRQQYLPRQEGTLKITARDANGKPVRAEVALGIADESVYAIQEDYAGDPRPFFYGQKRRQIVQTASSFSQKSYVRLVKRNDGSLVDERLSDLDALEKDNSPSRQQKLKGNFVGGVVGGRVGNVAEAITVTAESPAARNAPRPPMEDAKKASSRDELAAGAPGQEAAVVVVRNDFRSTVFWKPDLITGDDGTATIKFVYPDSLTSWRATARAVTSSTQVGMATETTRTRKPLIVRLQAPRFFVVGDQTVVSAIINNNTDHKLTVTPSLDASGLIVTGLFVDGKMTKGEVAPLTVEPDGEGRTDWVVTVKEPGEARLRVAAKSEALSDAMERTYPVEDHGIDKLVAVSGKMRGSEATMTLHLPAERRSTIMTVQVAPSIAVTMLDALPYLIDYPYGCTEQTMSRFLPAVIVARTLSDLGIPRETVAARLFGGIERGHAAQTHPDGKRDLQRLDEMTRAGLARLYDFQHSDGGWGWWKDGESDHHMTAYVVWGLALARDAGIDLRVEMLDRGIAYLQKELIKEERNPDRQAWMLHALAATARGRAAGKFEQTALDNLWEKRDRLSNYGMALLALSTQQFGLKDRALTLSRNLENGAAIDRAPDSSLLVKGSGSGDETVMATAHWGSKGSWWRWYDSPVESTALSLRALTAIDPKHRLIEPSMNWLVKNRRGAQWNNTRDTALAVLALTDYLRSSGEARGDLEYEVSVNGQHIATT
ncbi:MAG: alpha-2-macroglobulin family protein, partial [Thermoanaerobaculia bacterium]